MDIQYVDVDLRQCNDLQKINCLPIYDKHIEDGYPNLKIVVLKKDSIVYKGMNLSYDKVLDNDDIKNIYTMENTWVSDIDVAFKYAVLLSIIELKKKLQKPDIITMHELLDHIFDKKNGDIYAFKIKSDLILYYLFDPNNNQYIINKLEEKIMKKQNETFEIDDGYIKKEISLNTQKKLFFTLKDLKKKLGKLQIKKHRFEQERIKSLSNLNKQLEIFKFGTGYGMSWTEQKNKIGFYSLRNRNLSTKKSFYQNGKKINYRVNGAIFGEKTFDANRVSRSTDHDITMMDSIINILNVDGYYAHLSKSLFHYGEIFNQEICIRNFKNLSVRYKEDKYDATHDDNDMQIVADFIRFNIFFNNNVIFPRNYHNICYNELGTVYNAQHNSKIKIKNGLRIVTFNVHMWKKNNNKNNITVILI